MGGVEETFSAYATQHGLEHLNGFSPGPLTPLLTKGGGLSPALRGRLTADVDGVLARYAYGTEGGRFTFTVVYAEVPESQPFVPRLDCIRKGRLTDTTHYGFELRTARLWTESEPLNERFKVTTSPFQDPNWMRQLFSPTFVDWLGKAPPPDFSFELAYGSLLCSVEEDEPEEAALDALWEASSHVATRIRDECRE